MSYEKELLLLLQPIKTIITNQKRVVGINKELRKFLVFHFTLASVTVISRFNFEVKMSRSNSFTTLTQEEKGRLTDERNKLIGEH